VDVEDTAKIGLRFENGALGSIHLDYNQQPPAHYFEVIGTKGSLQWNLSDGATRIYRAEKNDWEVYPLAAGWERNVMFMDEMKHFIAVACGEVESSCPLEGGIRVQQLIEAIHQSRDSGRIIEMRRD
jgi:predicted dehydrogenase